jgi:hypothetical protein
MTTPPVSTFSSVNRHALATGYHSYDWQRTGPACLMAAPSPGFVIWNHVCPRAAGAARLQPAIRQSRDVVRRDTGGELRSGQAAEGMAPPGRRRRGQQAAEGDHGDLRQHEHDVFPAFATAHGPPPASPPEA